MEEKLAARIVQTGREISEALGKMKAPLVTGER
jgi:hypothetical protein